MTLPALPAFDLGNPLALVLLPLLGVFFALVARRSRRGMRPERARASLGVRLGVLALLVLALAEPRVRLPADRLAVSFLLDVSDSVPPAAREEALRFTREALAATPAGDEVAVVAFAGEALVERPAMPQGELPALTSNPPRGATDLAAALRVGLGLLPTDRARRLVVLSDGNENRGRAAEEVRVAAAAGVPVDFVAIGERREPEVLVRSLEAPSALREGDTFALRLTIESSAETTARVHLLTDGRLVEGDGGQLTGPVHLRAGTTSLVLPHEPLAPGFHTFQVQIESEIDGIAENNEGVAFTNVSGRPRVLLVEGRADEARFLADALRAGGIESTVAAPIALPTDLIALRAYDGVVLVNVPASALGPAQMETLKSFVQNLGGGLTLVGGDRAFILGGYQRTPLEEMSPLAMQRRGMRAQSSVALVLVIDTSGSMSDNVGGMTKLDLGKEAAIGAIDLLTTADQLGIVAFEDQPRWAVELEPLNDAEGARMQVRRMMPGGGTAIYPALQTAYEALADLEAKVKHVVLLTDGISPQGNYPELTGQMRDANITLSTIGIGSDADFNLLEQLADQGGGRYYEGIDPFQVPQIVVKETLEIARTAIVEEPFRPVPMASSPVLDGIPAASLPALRGYLALTPKPASLVILGSTLGDPVLAEWQYGLGQVVAWTSDSLNRWSADWIEWPEFSRFWTQVVKRTVPARVDLNLQTSVTVEGDRARITVDALGDDRSFRNFMTTTASLHPPGEEAVEVALEQVGPGRYEALAPITSPGAHLLQVVQRSPDEGRPVATQSTGFVTTAGDEYWQLQPNRPLLQQLARTSGGRELRTPAEAFTRDLRAPGAGRELWPLLTALAVALFLVDVAVRRLRISLTAAERVLAAVRERLPIGRAAVEPAAKTLRPALARLLAARQTTGGRPAGSVPTASATVAARLTQARAASIPSLRQHASGLADESAGRRPSVVVPSRPAASSAARSFAAAPTKPVASGSSAGSPAAAGTASRLLAAKQRAREGRR